MLSDVRGWIFQRACRHLHIPAINLRPWFAFLSPQSNGLHFTLTFFLIREMTQQGNSPYLRPGFLKNPINTFPHCLLKMGFPVEHSQERALCGAQRPNNGEHNWGAMDKFGGLVEAAGIKGRASADHTSYEQPFTIFPHWYRVWLLAE